MTMPPQNPPVALISETIDDAAVVRSRPTEDPAPMVLLLHGLGSDERDLAGLVPHLPPDFSYVSLRGIHRYVQGYARSEEHTSELQSRGHLVCRLLLEKKKKNIDK